VTGWLAPPFSKNAAVVSLTWCPRMQRSPPATVSPSAELQFVLRRMLERQEDERRQLARQLHDDLGQALAMLKLQLGALARQLGSTPSPRVQDCLELVQRALSQTRLLALEARPSLLDDLGIVPALRWLVQRRVEGTGVAGKVVADPENLKLPAPWLSTCFRVAEEALDNTLRHAQAQAVTVEVREHGGMIDMVIRDDGVGFSVTDPLTGGGLLTMRERVRLAGGEFDLQSRPGGGTEVRVRVVGGA
jgi:signal transduction histidine kinase